ncbi:helix-turn-helix transcriptional regulator [bacterium]|nr:helix-turn-helix transcriptional regulator [bacterium]
MKRTKERVKRLSKEEVFGILKHPIRVAILDLLYEQKGISWPTLRKKLDISSGQLDYHLLKLLAAGLVVKKMSKTNRPIYELSDVGTAVARFLKKVRPVIEEALISIEIG